MQADYYLTLLIDSCLTLHNPNSNSEHCVVVDVEDAGVSNSWWRLDYEAKQHAGFHSSLILQQLN